MWSRDKLAEIAEKRRQSKEKLPKAEEATLAYARWQGLTLEEDVDRESAKQTLDQLCDMTEPEDWSRLKELVGNVDDHLLKGVMHYALTRSLSQIREQQLGLAQTPSGPTPDRPKRQRRRTRSR